MPKKRAGLNVVWERDREGMLQKIKEGKERKKNLCASLSLNEVYKDVKVLTANAYNLKALMIRRNMTTEKMVEVLEKTCGIRMLLRTFRSKMNGELEWKYSEMCAIAIILNAEPANLFFPKRTLKDLKDFMENRRKEIGRIVYENSKE